MADISITRGDTHDFPLTVTTDGSAQDITGWEILFGARSKFTSPSYALKIVTPYDAGDSLYQLSAWDFGTTISSTNSDSAGTGNPSTLRKLYAKLTNSGSTRTVNVYKDSAMTILVATGNRSGDGSITLSASGGSGLAGSVTVTYTQDITSGLSVIGMLGRKGIEITDAAGGLATLHVRPEDTSGLQFDPSAETAKFDYEIEVRNPAGTIVKTASTGVVTITADVFTG